MTLAAVSWLPGHGMRPTGYDPGAISPAGWTEAELVRDIAAAAWRATEARRIPSEIVSAGSYAQRGQDADAGAGSRLVVQLHADASPAEEGPDVARVFYWPRQSPTSSASRGLVPALAIAEALRAVVPWPVLAVEATERWPGPRGCLASVRAVSVLVEVGFTDGRGGRHELPGLAEAIGRALGGAV